MKKLLVFLQCAWRINATFLNREDWLNALWKSYSGKRLKEMLPDSYEIYIENSTPKVGDNPDAIFPPDLIHMRNTIDMFNPDIILACGEVAQSGCEQLGIDFIDAPHPAYRALSKEMTASIKDRLEK